MSSLPKPKPAEFQYIQTATAWNRTLGTFARWCNSQPNERVLDIGCGPGLLPAIFANLGCRATGIDLDAAMFRPIPLHHQVVNGDAIRLPFGNGTFNLVTVSNLLFYLPQPGEALTEMARVLTPDGRIGLINPSPRLSVSAATAIAEQRNLDEASRATLISWAERAEHHQRWSPEELQQIARQTGLEISAWEYSVGPGFALFAMARKIIS